MALRLKKVCYIVSLCENCQRQNYKAFIGVTKGAKMICGGDSLYLKFWIKQTALVRSLFARSDSAVTPSEKSSINTNRKSTTRFPMSSRWTSYVVSKPQRVARKRKVSKMWTINCDNSETVRDRMPVTINQWTEVAYGLSIGTDLDDLERSWTP